MEPVFGLRSIIQQTLDSIPVQPGIHLFYPKVGFTKKKGFSRFNWVASGQRKYRGKEEDEPWYLLTNRPDLKSALEVYSKRYGREAMFKDCKTGGYNLYHVRSIDRDTIEKNTTPLIQMPRRITIAPHLSTPRATSSFPSSENTNSGSSLPNHVAAPLVGKPPQK